MHNVKLPEDIARLNESGTSRARYFSAFDASKTALLVIDMQNHWVDPRGASYTPTAEGIVPNINRLAAAFRAAGGPVVWISASLSETGRGAWPILFERLEDAATGHAHRAELIPGHPMHALWPKLEVREEDLQVHKDRFSAFSDGASNLEALLRQRGIDSLIVTGVATNICCESTARDAMMIGFRTVMVEDANAAHTDLDHLAGLRTFAQVFGAVMQTDDVISKLTG